MAPGYHRASIALGIFIGNHYLSISQGKNGPTPAATR